VSAAVLTSSIIASLLNRSSSIITAIRNNHRSHHR